MEPAVDQDLRSMTTPELERLVAAGIGASGPAKELALRAAEEIKDRWGSSMVDPSSLMPAATAGR